MVLSQLGLGDRRQIEMQQMQNCTLSKS